MAKSYSLGKSSRKSNALQKIFAETKRLSANDLNQEAVKEMQRGTVRYSSSSDGKLTAWRGTTYVPLPQNHDPAQEYKTSYRLMNEDSFVAAKELKAQNLNPMVLNLANKNFIGGGVEKGASAQEECLFRCSNYHLALYPHGEKVGNRYKYLQPIDEMGSYYAPKVKVFRNKDYSILTAPFFVSCLALPGYDLGNPHLYERTLRDTDGKPLQGEALLAKFKDGTKRKIRHLFDVALQHQHDSLVLGALSCGAFKLPNDNKGETAKRVSEAYYEVLQERKYLNRFKTVVFAILETQTSDKVNTKIFGEMVERLNLPKTRPDASLFAPPKPEKETETVVASSDPSTNFLAPQSIKQISDALQKLNTSNAAEWKLGPSQMTLDNQEYKSITNAKSKSEFKIFKSHIVTRDKNNIDTFRAMIKSFFAENKPGFLPKITTHPAAEKNWITAIVAEMGCSQTEAASYVSVPTTARPELRPTNRM